VKSKLPQWQLQPKVAYAWSCSPRSGLSWGLCGICCASSRRACNGFPWRSLGWLVFWLSCRWRRSFSCGLSWLNCSGQVSHRPQWSKQPAARRTWST